MKMNRRTALLLTAVCLAAAPAFADSFTLSLTPANTTLAAGETYTFTGTLTADAGNTGDLYIIGDSISADSPLVIDGTAFYTDTPLLLTPGDSYSGPLFSVSLPTSATSGSLLGNLDVELDDAAARALFQDAQFSVAAVPAATTPEPGSWLLLGSGLVVLVSQKRRFSTR